MRGCEGDPRGRTACTTCWLSRLPSSNPPFCIGQAWVNHKALLASCLAVRSLLSVLSLTGMSTCDGECIGSNLFMSPGQDLQLRPLMLQLRAGPDGISCTPAGHGCCFGQTIGGSGGGPLQGSMVYQDSEISPKGSQALQPAPLCACALMQEGPRACAMHFAMLSHGDTSFR